LSAMKTFMTSDEEPTRGEKLSPERWEKIREVFFSVIELEPKERTAFLNGVCAEDADLRRRVEALVAADEELYLPPSS
jgi:hypothetical protein